MRRNRTNLRYFLAGMLAFALCGFGLPGPQGSATGGGSFSGDLAGSTLTDTTQSVTLGKQATWDTSLGAITHLLGPSDQAFTLQAGSGQSLVFKDDTGTARLTVTSANLTVPTGQIVTRAGTSVFQFDSAQLRVYNHDLAIMTAGKNFLLPDDSVIKFGSGLDVFEQGELTSITADGSAQRVLSIVSGNGDAGSLTLVYTVLVSDGTDSIAEHGTVAFATIDTASGVVAATPLEASTQVPTTGGDSATTAWTVTTTDDGSLELNVAVSVTGFTASSCTVRWKATCSGDVTLVVP